MSWTLTIKTPKRLLESEPVDNRRLNQAVGDRVVRVEVSVEEDEIADGAVTGPKLSVAGLVNAVDDAAAAVGGVSVGELYRDGSKLRARQS